MDKVLKGRGKNFSYIYIYIGKWQKLLISPIVQVLGAKYKINEQDTAFKYSAMHGGLTCEDKDDEKKTKAI